MERRGLGRPVAVLVMCCALLPMLPGLLALGHRSMEAQRVPRVPHLQDASLPEWLNWFSTPGGARDFADDQAKVYWDMKQEMYAVLFFSGASSLLVDFVFLRGSTKSTAGALQLRTGIDIIVSLLFLWKLYGPYLLSLPVHASISFVVVHACLFLTSLFSGKVQRALRFVALGLIWAGNLVLIIYGDDVMNWLIPRFKAYETVVLESFVSKIAILFPLRLQYASFPLRLQFASNTRFTLFRAIDYSTGALLDPNHDQIRVKGVSSFVTYIHYCIYGPLVWQGPLISYKSFVSQMNRRYRESKRSDGSYGPLRVQGRAWRDISLRAFRWYFFWFVYEVICHNFLSGMLILKGEGNTMAAGQLTAAMVVQFLLNYIRPIYTWSYFELWATLDGMTPPENFPTFIFWAGSVRQVWQMSNRSVHLWLLANIYIPLCENLRLPSWTGTVATFAFMFVWHKATYSWALFSAGNCILVLFEQFVEDPTVALLPKSVGSLFRVIAYVIKAFCMLCMYGFIVIMYPRGKVVHESIWSYLDSWRPLWTRLFVDDQLPQGSIVLRKNVPFEWANLAELTGDAWWTRLLEPRHALLGLLGWFVIMRLAIEISRRQEEYDKSKTLEKMSEEPPVIIQPEYASRKAQHDALRARATQNASETFSSVSSVCQVLANRACHEQDADRQAILWLDGKGEETDRRTFAQLHTRACQIAASLTDTHSLWPGDRVVLVYPPGIAFVEAMFGCMYAGIVAVPVYPPDPRAALDRDKVFGGVIENCQPKLILCDSSYTVARHLSTLHFIQEYIADIPIMLRRSPRFRVALLAILLPAPFLLAQLFHRVRLTFKIRALFVLGDLRFFNLPDAEFKEAEEIGRIFSFPFDTSVLLSVAALSLYFIVSEKPFFAFANRRPVQTEAEDTRYASRRIIHTPWLQTDSFLRRPTFALFRADSRFPVKVSRDDVAYLQYTSGSTADPKGVRITHGNLMHQGFVNQISFGCVGRGETAVNWCPQYHDLGLVVCLLSGVFAGIRIVAMSPVDFLRDPLLWLRAISKYRAAFSAAPNFAYAYAARKARSAAANGSDRILLRGLDLSCWRIAGNGGEPVRPESLEAFCERFERYGFSRDAYFPCFGLAEHTILASGRCSRREPTYLTLCSESLARGKIVRVGNAARHPGPSVTLVGCGEAFPDVSIRVVEPESHRELKGEVGEIWLSSPSVGGGYWGSSQASYRETFCATSPDIPRQNFLRTGDLGFVLDKELFICGRLKDLIIVDGRNVYPQDIESTAEQACAGLFRPGSSAAFVATLQDPALGQSTGKLTLVLEVRRERTGGNLPAPEQLLAACASAYNAVLAAQRLSVTAFILAPPSALPKTSSGKIKRRRIAELVAVGALPILFQAQGAQIAQAAAAAAEDSSAAALGSPSDDAAVVDAYDDPHHPLYAQIVHAVYRANLNGEQYPESWEQFKIRDEILAEPLYKLLGSDAFSSIDAVQFANGLNASLQANGVHGFAVPPDLAIKHATVAKVATHIYNTLV